ARRVVAVVVQVHLLDRLPSPHRNVHRTQAPDAVEAGRDEDRERRPLRDLLDRLVADVVQPRDVFDLLALGRLEDEGARRDRLVVGDLGDPLVDGAGAVEERGQREQRPVLRVDEELVLVVAERKGYRKAALVRVESRRGAHAGRRPPRLRRLALEPEVEVRDDRRGLDEQLVLLPDARRVVRGAVVRDRAAVLGVEPPRLPDANAVARELAGGLLADLVGPLEPEPRRLFNDPRALGVGRVQRDRRLRALTMPPLHRAPRRLRVGAARRGQTDGAKGAAAAVQEREQVAYLHRASTPRVRPALRLRGGTR